MKESTRRQRHRQAHERQWAEIIALSADGHLGKSAIARRAGHRRVRNAQAICRWM